MQYLPTNKPVFFSFCTKKGEECCFSHGYYEIFCIVVMISMKMESSCSRLRRASCHIGTRGRLAMGFIVMEMIDALYVSVGFQ